MRRAFAPCSGNLPCSAPSCSGLLRNVAIAMGNSGLASYLPKLQEWAAGPDPVLAEAARWALTRLSTAETIRKPSSDPTSGATYDVRGVEAFGSLLAFKFHRIALVQSLIAVLLYRGEVYEDILTGGTLDKPVSFGSVEPLDHAIFLQANSLSLWMNHLQHSSGTPPAAVTVCQT